MTQLEQIKYPIADEIVQYKAIFDRVLHHPMALLNDALDHVRQRSGKMMRPTLVMLSAKAVGSVTEEVLHAAAALELLHTASLVHDDVVDESNERRGQLSVNAAYGNKVAVLVGDYLLSSALAEGNATRSLRAIELVTGLGHSLAEGEMEQLTSIRNKVLSEETYFSIINRKTGTLFAVSAEMGALLGGGSEENIARMRAFGEVVGTCFQIRDDIFDYIADASVIGKPVGNDMTEGKLTLPALHVLLKTHDEAMMKLAMKVKAETATPDEIASLVEFTKRGGGIAYAEQQMAEYRNRGIALLEELPESDVRDALSLYLDYAVRREQ